MANTQHTQGPGQRVFSIGQRIVTLLAEMVETRLRLVVVELEEEKANLFQLLIMTGLTLLFAAFGLMSLLVLVIWAVDAQYRLHVMIATTGGWSAGSCASRQSASRPERGRFSRRPALPLPRPIRNAVRNSLPLGRHPRSASPLTRLARPMPGAVVIYRVQESFAPLLPITQKL